MRSAESAPAIRHAVALGLLQGPAELLPVSSSGHTALLPWLAGWSHTQLDGELRKALEVAMHAGAGAALALDMRAELLEQLGGIDRARAGMLALSLAPAALTGLLARRAIEQRLGGPRSIAAALALGGIAMALADTRAQEGGRSGAEARASDGLLLGLAQAAALVPGVSRNGATLTAARARGFSRAGAQALSWELALPVIVAASALKGSRLARQGVAPAARAPLAAGALSAFVSTFVSARILRRRVHAGAPLGPYALYRCLLAAVVLFRSRHSS